MLHLRELSLSFFTIELVLYAHTLTKRVIESAVKINCDR